MRDYSTASLLEVLNADGSNDSFFARLRTRGHFFHLLVQGSATFPVPTGLDMAERAAAQRLPTPVLGNVYSSVSINSATTKLPGMFYTRWSGAKI